MTWRIVIEVSAEQDLQEAFLWYEEQLAGLGFRFNSYFNSTIERIQRNPYHASVLLAEVRSATIAVFPYEVLYMINKDEQTIFVLAVAHQHRKPGWFIQRLK